MFGKNWKYKELDFSGAAQDLLQKTLHYSFPLQKVNDDLKSRTDEFINANYHGGILSHSLYGVRYINFSGAGDCLTTETRGIVLEILKKNLSLAPGTDDNEYFDLFRETGDGKPRTCKAKVSQAITAEHDVTALKFGYSFQLACPSEKVYGLETYTEQIPMGFFSGSPLPQALPFAIGGFGGGGSVENQGNRNAPVKIQVIGKCTNPKIFNATTGQALRLEATTQSLVYDNRNIDMIQGKDWVIDNLGQDITSKRKTGKDIYLAPGENHIVVISDDPLEEPEIFITWRDTFNY